MPKGFFTQGMCLLTDGTTTIELVKKALAAKYEIAREVPATENYYFGGDRLIIAYLPKVNGNIDVDVISHPWPDDMGNPKTNTELFGAWSMGHMGPFTYPGGLLRAQQNSWHCREASKASLKHKGFIRTRCSYIFGADKNALCIPKDYKPLDELKFLSKLSLALMNTPGVLCYFNPNGEVLVDKKFFDRIWDWCVGEEGNLPLQLWSNVRMYNLDSQLLLTDTVGNRQMDVNDIEAIFPKSEYEPGAVAYYLRNVTHYLLDSNREIRSGEAFDGPGENNLSWVVEVVENGAIAPPRTVFRLCPKKNREQAMTALAAITESK